MEQQMEEIATSGLQRRLRRLLAWRFILLTWFQLSSLGAFIGALVWRTVWQPFCFIGVIIYVFLAAVILSQIEKHLTMIRRRMEHSIL
ncbi:hypothetical protein LMC02_09860 [Limosilactobacillus reuteri]|uniref:hypothetical protein n=1 Tax=Limosilactobacillus reuteri TaxID=1598 RepID=UPI001E5A9F8A|nr:hypothetical protein [Limosilactobacillus reuteri]MCC4500292.1 hypothetical protein [Limosilactobacillus reuteri]MCC4500617.1 hypothetical protein [Limosilactobacillus reuteri]